MEAIILIGIPACGKSSFCKQRLTDSHIRINLDMLRTRHREQVLIKACLAAKQPLVVDNTNPTVEDRARYIQLAKATGFSVVGYYFQSQVQASVQRNATRIGDARVSDKAIFSIAKQLEMPSYAERFDDLFYVRLVENNDFEIARWQDEL
jgi:predicted kinase